MKLNQVSGEPDPKVMVPRADREWSVNNLPGVQIANYNHALCKEDCIDWSGGLTEGNMRSDKFLSGPSDDPVIDCQDGVTVQFGVEVLR